MAYICYPLPSLLHNFSKTPNRMKHIRLENTDSDLAILEDVTSSKASKLYKKTLADALFFLFFSGCEP